jgi:hypothetical protein
MKWGNKDRQKLGCINKSPITASTCLEVHNFRVKMKKLVKKKALRCAWKKCIQIVSQKGSSTTG